MAASLLRTSVPVTASRQASVRSSVAAMVAPTPQAKRTETRSAFASVRNIKQAATRSVITNAAKTVAPVGDKTVIITGASSGMGLQAARWLAEDNVHVIMACRDFTKAEKAAKREGLKEGTYTILHLDLGSLTSVRQFVSNFRAMGRSLDVLVCNAAVYFPTAKEPVFNGDGFELSVATNHLGHFLLTNLLLEDLKATQAKTGDARCIIVGSITGNRNTLAGRVPPQADLGALAGMESGFTAPITMIDGGEFDGAKAYKDSKVCNMLTVRELADRFKDTGITFASLYPGCIATTGLFRSHFPLFKTLFPIFQKYVTKGYVSEEEAGRRLSLVVKDPEYKANGSYYSWNTQTNAGFVNTPSDEVQDGEKGKKLWELSEKLVGLA